MRVREDFTELFCSGLKSGNILLWYQCFNVWWRELVPYQKSARITIPVRSTMPTCPSKILPSKLQDRRLPFVYAIDTSIQQNLLFGAGSYFGPKFRAVLSIDQTGLLYMPPIYPGASTASSAIASCLIRRA